MSAATTSSAGSSGAAGGARRRVSWWIPIWALFALSLRQHLRGKRWIAVSLLFLIPTGLAILARSTAHDLSSIRLEFTLAFMFLPQAVIPLVALIYSSGIIQDEQEEQTITYLLIRPIPKWAIYLTKLLATWLTCVTLTALFTFVLYLAIYAGGERDAAEYLSRAGLAITVHSLSIVTYCAIFALLSLLTKRALIFGIVYIAAVEGLLANMPFGLRLFTVIYYSRLIAYRWLPFLAMPSGSSGFFQLFPQNLAAEAWQLTLVGGQLFDYPEVSTCLETLGFAIAACALLGAFLCTQKEFHVKTPGKE